MQKIIIDTNVLVSALIQRSYPFFIVDNAFLDKNIQWCISDPILAEYHAVLSRPKFSKYPGFIASAESLLAHIELLAIKYVPSISINIIDDPDDNKFIELAHECGITNWRRVPALNTEVGFIEDLADMVVSKFVLFVFIWFI